MFERFTDRARRVVVLAQEEARGLVHDHIGSEHLLLGLVQEGGGVAWHALDALGVDAASVREEVEALIGRGRGEPMTVHIPFTPGAKKVLQLSLREALQMGHDYIGTEHILLGLIREGEGVGARALKGLGVDLQRVRQEVISILSGYQPATQGVVRPAVEPPSSDPFEWPRCPGCLAVLMVGDLGNRRIPLIEDGRRQMYLFLFCRTCGHILRIDREA
jgi:ATP-dependent Clp protease ATP-binding subunit ClpC